MARAAAALGEPMVIWVIHLALFVRMSRMHPVLVVCVHLGEGARDDQGCGEARRSGVRATAASLQVRGRAPLPVLAAAAQGAAAAAAAASSSSSSSHHSAGGKASIVAVVAAAAAAGTASGAVWSGDCR